MNSNVSTQLSASTISAKDTDRYYEALVHRDASYDGTFIAAVKTTGIYCRPICPARKPLRKNVVFFETTTQAIEAGFRACLRCDP